MLLTEEEAKTRWCPFAANALPAGSTRARPDLGEGIVETLPQAMCGNRPAEPGVLCLGSQCMAWRWLDYIGEEGDAWRVTWFAPGHGHSAQKLEDPSQRRGFCGLAGGVK